MEKLREGYVVVLRKGLKVLQMDPPMLVEPLELPEDTTVIVEAARIAPPGSEDDHFTECGIYEGRVLRADGSYDPAMPRYMFAQYGDFAPEFIQTTFTILRKLRRTYEEWN